MSECIKKYYLFKGRITFVKKGLPGSNSPDSGAIGDTDTVINKTIKKNQI